MPVERPEISVVIPVRDGAASLGTQLQALTEQVNAPPFEVVVADNGSTDGTAAVATDFCDRLDLRVIDAGETPGPSYARNCGARAARTPLVLFCDADDRVGPHWVGALHHLLADHELVTGPVLYVDDARSVAIGDAPATPLPSEPRRYLDQAPFAPSNNLGMRRGLIDELNGFDLDLKCCQDADLTIRAQVRGAKLGWSQDALVLNSRRSSLRASARQFFRYGYYDALVYRKLRGRGLEGRTALQMLRPYLVLLATAHRLLTARRRWSWVINASQRAGRLVGSVRFRVFCP